jgi:hypothetical protein
MASLHFCNKHISSDFSTSQKTSLKKKKNDLSDGKLSNFSNKNGSLQKAAEGKEIKFSKILLDIFFLLKKCN